MENGKWKMENGKDDEVHLKKFLSVKKFQIWRKLC